MWNVVYIQGVEFMLKDYLKRFDNMKIINNELKIVVNDSLQRFEM